MAVDLFAPQCSITVTRRKRWFWALWTSGPPVHVPFRRPDDSDGGAPTFEAAVDAATARAGAGVMVVDPLWARAWMRLLRGQPAWPTRASREPRPDRGAPPPAAESGSIWAVLGVERTASDEVLKASYRRRVLETHPDHGGDPEALRAVVRAYVEARRRRKRPPPM